MFKAFGVGQKSLEGCRVLSTRTGVKLAVAHSSWFRIPEQEMVRGRLADSL